MREPRPLAGTVRRDGQRAARTEVVVQRFDGTTWVTSGGSDRTDGRGADSTAVTVPAKTTALGARLARPPAEVRAGPVCHWTSGRPGLPAGRSAPHPRPRRARLVPIG